MRNRRYVARSLPIAAALLVGCGLFKDIECGPLTAAVCQARIAEIEAVVVGEFPGRRITSIQILNEEGHATVRLDDGTKVGFGERLESGR